MSTEGRLVQALKLGNELRVRLHQMTMARDGLVLSQKMERAWITDLESQVVVLNQRLRYAEDRMSAQGGEPMSKQQKQTAEAKGKAVKGQSTAITSILGFLGKLVDRLDRIEARIETLGQWTDAPTPEADEDDPVAESERTAFRDGLDPDRRFGGNWPFLDHEEIPLAYRIVKASKPVKPYQGRKAKVAAALVECIGEWDGTPVLTRRDTAYLGWAIGKTAKGKSKQAQLRQSCQDYLEEANTAAAQQGCGPVEPGTLHEFVSI